MPAPSCAQCGVATDATTFCAVCRFAFYCGARCQTEHHHAHEPLCAAIAAECAAREEAKGRVGALEEDLDKAENRVAEIEVWIAALRVTAAEDVAEEAERRAEAERGEAVAARKHALRRAHVSLDVGRYTAVETVGALRDFPEDAGLAVKALKAFAERISKQEAVDAGAAAAVVAAICAHAAVSDIAHFGFWALGKFASSGPVGRQAAIDAGAAAAIVNAMRAHVSVADVTHFGCWALADMAALPAGQQAAIDAGATATIVAAMRAHKSVSEVA
jgi:hypothetical protein